MGEKLLAVFDVGKTNKKFTVYNSNLAAIYSETVRIGEIEVSGIVCDDIDSLTAWVKTKLADWRSKLSAVAVSTHGATLALLDAEGRLAMPVISYNHEVGERVKQDFFEEFGSPEELYERTGTPPLGQLLNAGIQLYWIRREFPERYARAKRILFLPQYVIHSFSRLEAAELTSLGCHTYLWDLAESGWSVVAEGLDVPFRSPTIRSVWERLGEAEGVVVTPGIHDSNAALLPYLVRERGGFVLASTGTWCVLMYPGAPFSPSREDIYRDVLYYVDAYGRPVKAARFKCGFEFEHYVNLLKRTFGGDPLAVGLDRRLAVEVLKAGEAFFVPTLTPGTGQFPRSKGRVVGCLTDLVRAYHYLNLSLAVQTWHALKLLTGGRKVKVYVQGGFAKNDVYLAYLATLARWSEVIKGEYPEATSLGAALTALAALEGCEPRQLGVELPAVSGEPVEPLDVDDAYVEEYVRNFLSLCSG
jgi:L-fuculokinase